MLELPTETWDTIVSVADRTTVLNLASVSKSLLTASRRVLAREVKLGTHYIGGKPRPDPMVVLSFIAKYELSCWVQDLSLINLPSELQIASIPLEKMHNLEKLSVHGSRSLFETPAGEKAFVYQLMHACTKLRSLTWRIKSHENAGGLFDSDFPVSGLTAIGWEDYDEPSKPCLSLLRASLTTVTRLSISIYPRRGTAFLNLADLLDLVFPQLSDFKFEFGYGVPDPVDENTERVITNRFTDFLVRHPQVSCLTLNVVDGPLYALLCTKGNSALSADILPNLRELYAHPRHVTAFSHAKAHFLQKLTTLSIQGVNGELEELEVCFRSLSRLAKASKFSALKHMELTFPDVDSSYYLRDPFVEWMKKSSSMFPLLEKLTLEDLTPIIYWLPNHFPKFDNLRHLDCHVDRYDFRRKHVKQLAWTCRSLERITFKRDPEYKVIRSATGVVLEVEG